MNNSATSKLTIRKLPIFTDRTGNDFKIRVDRALSDLVADSVQLQYPNVRVGKRFSIEYALLSWLRDQGLVAEGAVIPGCNKAEGSHGGQL